MHVVLQKKKEERNAGSVNIIITRVGQNRIYTPYMTVHSVISLPKIPYTHRIYMVLANPNHYGSGRMLFCVLHHPLDAEPHNIAFGE